ncbi:MAG: transposase [Nitrosomonadaceae bacterium]|nr:transposase [Nitrosomonadaceae bacterium]
MALGSMFRIYCMQNWFNLSDRQMEDALYEIESMRRFTGFGGVTATLPDETTILNFRYLLEQYECGIAGGDQCSPQVSRAAGFQRHDGGCHTHSCAKFDQESGTGA